MSEALYVLHENPLTTTGSGSSTTNRDAGDNQRRSRSNQQLGSSKSGASNRNSTGAGGVNPRSSQQQKSISSAASGGAAGSRASYQGNYPAGDDAGGGGSSFVSPRDRLFGLSPEVYTFSTELLEKSGEGIIKAAKNGDLVTLKQLHERGHSLLSIDETGQTALHISSKLGHRDIVRYLIACAPTSILNMIDNDKFVPFFFILSNSFYFLISS